MKDQKDQQRTTSKQQAQRSQRDQEQQLAKQLQMAQIPAQQWAQLLQHTGGHLLELPAAFLEQLSSGVGNSHLMELLRQGGGDAPTLCAPGDLQWAGEGLEDNPIQTAPPALYPLKDADFGRVRLSPVRPDALRAGG